MSAQPVLAKVSLDDEIDKFKPSDDDASGRRAEILVKDDHLRVTLVTVRAGTELSEHSAPAPITIHVLKGRVEVRYEGGSAELGENELISLRESIDHQVRAIEDGAFLLTLGWSSNG